MKNDSIREVDNQPYTLPNEVIEVENLFVAFKRIERERDDLVLNHLGIEQIKGDLPKSEADVYSQGAVINERLITFLKSLSKELQHKGWIPQLPLYLREMKASGVERLKARLALTDAIVYQAIINVMMPQFNILQIAAKEVPRVNFTNPPKSEAFLGANLRTSVGQFSYHLREKYYSHWKAYHLTKRGSEACEFNGERYALYFDVSAFFDNINHQQLTDMLKELKVSDHLINALLRGLSTWQGDESRSLAGVGLPQGYEASAILSELYLMPLDKELSNLNSQGYRAGRYVDDVFIITTCQIKAEQGELGLRDGPLRQLSSLLRGMGLHLNPSKIEYKRLKPWTASAAKTLESDDEAAKVQAANVLVEVCADIPKETPFDLTHIHKLPPQKIITHGLELIQSKDLTVEQRSKLLSAVLSIGDGLVKQLYREHSSMMSSVYYYIAKRSPKVPSHLQRFIQQRQSILNLLKVAEQEQDNLVKESLREGVISQIKEVLMRLDGLSGRQAAEQYLNTPDLSVAQPAKGEGGEAVESLKERAKRLKRLLKGMQYLIYEHQHSSLPISLAMQLTEIARLEETLLISATHLLDRFEHNEELINLLISIAETYSFSATARYSIYRHLAELKTWPANVDFKSVFSKLCEIEKTASPSYFGILGLLELVVRCGEEVSKEQPVLFIKTFAAIDLSQYRLIQQHHPWLFK